MGGKITYFFLATVLILVFGVVALEGVLLLLTGEPAAMGMGAMAFLLPCIGGWFLWHNTRFARDAHRLARVLEAEGALPADELQRTPAAGSTGTRPTRSSPGGRPRPRKRPATGVPGSGSRWPTTTPGTPPAPVRRCSAPSPCTTTRPSRLPELSYGAGPTGPAP